MDSHRQRSTMRIPPRSRGGIFIKNLTGYSVNIFKFYTKGSIFRSDEILKAAYLKDSVYTDRDYYTCLSYIPNKLVQKYACLFKSTTYTESNFYSYCMDQDSNGIPFFTTDKFRMQVAERNILIHDAPLNAHYVLMDLQGRILRQGVIPLKEFQIPLG
jgi:hypothetical protein